MFSIGDTVTLPEHGKCTITTTIQTNRILKKDIKYILKPENARFSEQRIVMARKKLEKLALNSTRGNT